MKRTLLVFAALLSIPLAGLPAAEPGVSPKVTLVRDGQAQATIVVAQSAGRVPWFAASELQYHVRKMTGATLPICTDEAEIQGSCILVGASRRTEAMGLRTADFKPQEYLIGFRRDTLVLMGRDPEDDPFPVRVTGQPGRVEGKFGKALEFTGAQGLSVCSHGFSDESGTLEAWVWLGAERPNAGTIFRLDGNPWTYHIVDTQGDTLRYVVYDGQTGHSVSSAALAQGWHHLCAAHDARAGQMELFVDGASCGTAAYPRTSCSNAPALMLGAFVVDGQPRNAFRGRLDEVHVSRAAHGPAPDWKAKPRPMDTNTLVRLSFDELSGPPRELSGRPRVTTPPSLDEAMSSQGTACAVYDFLERFCDVRWYAPTELGMVCPQRATLDVGGEDIRRRPAFEFRHHAPSGVAKAYVGLSAQPTDEEQRLFVARRRLGGRSFMTNHSFYDFYDRFWERNPQRPELFEGRRPEYWAKGYSGKPPQLCYTSPQLIAQVVKDARAKLDRGADYVQLVPMDNDQQCKCPNCQALIDHDNKSRQFSTGKTSGLFWAFANAVAREVRQSHPDKFVGAIAYYDYAFPPRFDLEPNILVGPCLHTRNWWSPSMERNDMAFYQGWVKQVPGRLHCVWLYQCFPDEIAENNGFKPFPGFHAHTLSRQFQMFARDQVRGIFLCGVASYIDGYLTFRCLNDPFFDVNRALDEFFTSYYGPAAAPMKQLYLAIEETYMTPANYPETVQKDDIHFHQTEEMAWRYLGTAERMDAWAKLVDQAQAAAETAPQKERVAIFVKDIWRNMLEGRQKWATKHNSVAPGPIGRVTTAAPYPRSPVITKLSWDESVLKLKTQAGDNWPITWVEGDLQITAWGDGPGFDEQPPRLSLGFARVWGDPPNLKAEDFATDADTLEGGGSKAIKASGLLQVDGVLYMWVRNYRPAGSDDFTNARLAWSKNHGTNWIWAGWHFADTFGCPEFVQFGPSYSGARDGYVYVVSQANDSAYGYSPEIVMARVPKAQVLERDRYEFFAGLDSNSQPLWSKDLGQRKPIFRDPQGTQRIAITYNAGLKRYLLTTSHRPAGSQATHTAALGVFDAPEPWGPWTTVYYNSQWSGTNRTYHHKFPTKWMSSDGRTLWLLYSGLDGGLYTFCLKKATLEIAQ